MAIIELVNPSFKKENFDGVCVVAEQVTHISSLSYYHNALTNYAKLSNEFDKPGSVVVVPHDSAKFLIIYASVGANDGDFDDSQAYVKSGTAVIKKAIACGMTRPLFVVASSKRFDNAQMLVVLGALHALYIPLNVREDLGADRAKYKFDKLFLHLLGNFKNDKFMLRLEGIRDAFHICRDIGDGDPVLMSPGRVLNYVQRCFSDSCIKVWFEENEDLTRGYPLLAAVNRANANHSNHRARLIWLEYDSTYRPHGELANETLYLVGKGVTFDTGGTNLKIGGSMFGMSRDKYGSAVVAGFFAALNALRPPGLRVIGAMCMVRNSIGSNAFTCDEIITSRSGKRIHICYTDAEGRLAMLDPLTKCREEALNSDENNVHLFTIATLTGHCLLTYGDRSAVMDNGPARGYAQALQATGDRYGQPVEVSRLCNKDFEFHSAESEMADLRQSNIKPSTQTIRGHMSPAGFLIRGSRLDEHDTKSERPLRYTHIDIGEAMGGAPSISFPNPLLTLIAHHILRRI